MLCSFCKQNDATIHFTEIINGKAHKMHLCEACAKEKQIDVELPFSFSDVLSAISEGLDALTHDTPDDSAPGPQCSHCGLAMREFTKSGRLGCPHCYDAFEVPLRDIIRSVQKAPHHTGKVPEAFMKTEGTRQRIAELERTLAKAVADERYEECVALRDELRQLRAALEQHANA